MDILSEYHRANTRLFTFTHRATPHKTALYGLTNQLQSSLDCGSKQQDQVLQILGEPAERPQPANGYERRNFFL